MTDKTFESHKSAVYAALDAALAGDAKRAAKILRFARCMGSPESTRAHMRAWFKEHAPDPKAAVLAQAFARREAEASRQPPQKVIEARPFPYEALDFAVRIKGIKA